MNSLRNKVNLQDIMFFSLLIVAILLLTDKSYAFNFWDMVSDFVDKNKGQTVTISTMFINFDMTGRSIISAIKFTAYLAGFALFCGFCLSAIRAGEGKERATVALMKLIASLLLISFVPYLDTLSNSLGFNGASIGLSEACNFKFTACADQMQSLSDYSKAAITGVITLIRLVGLISLFKGITILCEKNQGRPIFLRFCVYTIAGALCYNIIQFAIIVSNTLMPHNKFSSYLLEQYGKEVIKR